MDSPASSGRLAGVTGDLRRAHPEKEFLGRAVRADMDDNTVLLLDFGEGLVAVVYGTAAGARTASSQAASTTEPRARPTGCLLNGELRLPRQRRARRGGGRSERQQPLLPHVTGGHRDIGEAHVFEDVMQLVDWVRDGDRRP